MSNLKLNIFSYAPGELSQDAFLLWLFNHLEEKGNQDLYNLSWSLLNEFLISSGKDQITNRDEYKIFWHKQYLKIDVLIQLDGPTKILILLEDKVHAEESRSNQVDFYKSQLEKDDVLKGYSIYPIYFKTGYIGDWENVQNKYPVFDTSKIYEIMKSHIKPDGSIILRQWWDYFVQTYFNPLVKSREFQVNGELDFLGVEVSYKSSNIYEAEFFKKLSAFLFHALQKDFLTGIHPQSGAGHVDWHFSMWKDSWKILPGNNHKGLEAGIYFMWNGHAYSVQVKTATVPYQPMGKLNENERDE